jgi:hypothetical protein
MLSPSFFLLLTSLSALTLALDYPFTPDGKVKQGALTPYGKFKQSGSVKEVDSRHVVMNLTDNTYFNSFAGMTTLARPEADVAIARAKHLNATLTTRDLATHVEEKRDDASAGVYLCNGSNWGGGCWYTVTTGGLCHNLNNPPYGTHSSFGPDGNVQCVIYNQPNCQQGWAVYDKYTWPGTSNLNWPGDWSGTAAITPKSYKCRWCYGCFYGNAPHWIDSNWDYPES